MRKLLFIIALFYVPAAYGQGILQNPIQGPITASSTNCATQGDQSCLWMKLPANAAVVSVTVSGTFSETLVAEYTGDSGAHWTTAATLTTAGLTSYVVAGMTDFRVRASAVVSGTALITIQASLAPSGGVTDGTTDPTGNACAANALYVLTTNGALYTCKAGVFALLSGGSTVSITATAPIVVTPSPTTGTGVISAPTVVTSAAAITNNVLAKGSGGAQGLANSSITDNGTTVTGTEPFLLGDGLVGSPSYAFSSAPTTGLWRDSAGFIEFSVAGVSGMSASNNGLILGNAKTINFFSNVGAQDTGISRVSAGILAVGTGTNGSTAGTLELNQLNLGATLVAIKTAPTIVAGGCGGSAASISANNGTAAFNINVGTGPTSAGCTVTMPAATTGWNCSVNDMTTKSTAVSQQSQTGAISTTSVTFQNFSDLTVATAPSASDIYHVICSAY